MTSFSRKDLFLLALLTLCWGFNWPIMKIGVTHYPPLAFRILGMAGALPVLWLAARMQGMPLAISRHHVMPLIRLSIPNVLLWNLFMIMGITTLSSGRSAILGYTMPVWAVLFGLVLYREQPNRIGWFGIVCAFVGTLLLLSSEFSKISGQPLGSVLMLLGAASWGYGTLRMKRAQVDLPTIAMTFWMVLFSTLVLFFCSALFEYADWCLPTPMQWAAIAYNALLVFGFAFVVWFRLARTLPPVASSLSVMMIPVVGVFSGAWMLGETPHWQDYGAMALILVSLATVLVSPKKA
ncbi:MAG: EamA family transporter [Burkholderiaceae bacterium]|nr:EamA family transporter [Burkholderiaceae bacterium]